MNYVDKTFGPIAPPLISKFGTDVIFVKREGSGTYDPATGKIQPAEERFSIKAVIMTVTPEQVEGLYQATDLILYVNPASISNNWIAVKDYFELQQGDKTQVAEVYEVKAYRGDNPILFRVMARPQ